MNVLGISCFYHDSAACLVIDGEIIAAAEEERFTREKHDNSFPKNAIEYCLDEADLGVDELEKIVFYEKPIEKFDRILETAADVFPHGYKFFSEALPEWLGTKLRVRKKLRKNIGYKGKVEFVEHHHSHAASAFHPSPFNEAAVLTVDGVGEWKTNQMWKGEEDVLEPIKHIKFPDSIGLLYSTITSFLGFMVNNGEFKVMGLASFGAPKYEKEFEKIIETQENGSYNLNQKFFAYRNSKKMWSDRLEGLLGEPRSQNEEITQRHKDIAASMQKVLEKVILSQVQHLYEITEAENLCMAGGVALNSVANGRIKKESEFENIWIQPAAGDDGGALGAALARSSKVEDINHVYYGPSYSNEDVKKTLEENDLEFKQMRRSELIDEISTSLEEGKVVALFRGRMEWGPRALGNRSILADPRSEKMKEKINKKIKFRENFRPFAPSVLQDYAQEYFDIEEIEKSPYMLSVHDVKDGKQGKIPAVTHIDGTSRIQTVESSVNPFYYDLIDEFRERTGTPVVLNTSFNLKGMPIVRSPENAIECLENSNIDLMAIENFIVKND